MNKGKNVSLYTLRHTNTLLKQRSDEHKTYSLKLTDFIINHFKTEDWRDILQEYFPSPVIPLESFLLLSLFPDFWELFLVVLPCFALLGFPAGIVFYPVHFLLPCLHQLIVTLADFLFLLNAKNKPSTKGNTPSDQYMAHGQAPGMHRFFLLQSLPCWRWLVSNFQHREGGEVDTKM